MNRISIVFAGTGAFGRLTLEALARDKRFEIPFVITGEDKKSGRGLLSQESEIKKIARKNKLIIHQPAHMGGMQQKIIQAKPDFVLVVAYGEIIPEELLKTASRAWINIHGSLLPDYRGASPIHEALLRGDRKTGLTWLTLNKKLDAGNIIDQVGVDISEEDNFRTLFEKLSRLSAEKTGDVLNKFMSSGKSNPQEESRATYCRKINKEDGFIDVYKENAENIVRKIKAYLLWPGCSIPWNDTRLKLIQASVGEQKISPGEVALEKGNIFIGTSSKTLRLIKVQPQNKKPMSAEEFLRGQRNIPRKI